MVGDRISCVTGDFVFIDNVVWFAERLSIVKKETRNLMNKGVIFTFVDLIGKVIVWGNMLLYNNLINVNHAHGVVLSNVTHNHSVNYFMRTQV